MLIAIFKCLGGIAGDQRLEKPKRERSEKCMDAMSGRHAVECGIATDYSEVCMRFIRRWDRRDKDPARSSRVLADFRHQMDTLFVKGYILCDPAEAIGNPMPSTSGPIAGLMRPKTITQIAMEQLLEGADVHVDVMGKRKQLWSRADKRGVLDMMAEVKSVVEASLERLEAEFPTHSLYVCLEVFDLAAWESLISAARRSDTLPAEASLKAKEMRRKGRRLFEALGLEWDTQTLF